MAACRDSRVTASHGTWNGRPAGGGYQAHQAHREQAERDAWVAAFVAAAQARADAMPGAVPRCGGCRKPDAECVCAAGHRRDALEQAVQ